MNDVVQKFSAQVPSEVFQLKKSPSLRKSTDETPATFSNLYNSIPTLNLDYIYDNIETAIPDMNTIVSNIRDTANTIDLTPVKAAGQDILAVLPTLAIISFYGLVAYFILALLFRVCMLICNILEVCYKTNITMCCRYEEYNQVFFFVFYFRLLVLPLQQRSIHCD